MKKSRLCYLGFLVFIILMVAAGCDGKAADNRSGTQISNVIDKKVEKETDTASNTNITFQGTIEKGNQEQAASKTSSRQEENKSSTNRSGTTNSKTTVANSVESGGSSTGKISLLVTRDFGGKTLLDKKVELKKSWTVIDVLQANTKIATGWDGGLVTGINGLQSDNGGMFGKRQDWFYFVNGICADVGAAEYELRAGELVWWDYHAWESMGLVNSAVIGCYPEPFIHGYRGKVGPTTIVSHADNLTLAGDLQQALRAKGVSTVNVKELDENLLKNRQGPTIVIGEWNRLKDIPWLETLNKAYRKNGTCIHFTGEGLELLNYRGQVGRTITGSVGVIAATGEGLGDHSPLWLVAGTDREGLQQAVDVLVKSPGKISRLYSAVVDSRRIIGLPL